MSSTKPYSKELFSRRHIGPGAHDLKPMLETVGVDSLDQLIDETLPPSIRLKENLPLPESQTEAEFLEAIRALSKKNKIFKSYIGMGYYDTHTPGVILRNILESPGWYTQYTPYQSEISQGRLEALLNFQTMVMDLTGMEIANASLLDEGTAAAEAMFLCFNLSQRQKSGDKAGTFYVSDKCFPQTLEVLKSRAEPLGIHLEVGNISEALNSKDVFGILVQYPDGDGSVRDYTDLFNQIHSRGGLCVAAADLLSLTLLTPPGEFGADVVVGSSQRFGVPMGYGGPHAAFFATRDQYKRQVPGRLIGVSKDASGNPALRMALQTREQHIRREKATSNICTAQVLLAIMASMYAVYHGPDGLKTIARRIHDLAAGLAKALEKLGFARDNEFFFDSLKINISGGGKNLMEAIREDALNEKINFRYYPGEMAVGISLDETTTPRDIKNIISLFSRAAGSAPEKNENDAVPNFLGPFKRRTPYLTHPVFNTYHSETEMLRYIKRLENKDLSLNISMIPLGSCTMKLNATSEMIPVTWPEFARIHPFAPRDQASGYEELFSQLEDSLKTITGFTGVSLQPNAGSQGEFTGLLLIREYHARRGDPNRNLLLIPASAHGTNPASATLAGMKIIAVSCDERGNISLEDLERKAVEHRDRLAGLMVTYPSTHGVFEEDIQSICGAVHKNGGLVYMDGANMNAQVGLCHPASIGADVCHLNLHKTFCIPHGGGGPGVGPVCVNDKLKPYLPGHSVVSLGDALSVPAVAAAPWGSAGILVISHAYIRMMGREGLTLSTKIAILNANYMAHKLKDHFPILYSGKKERVAHEFILDFRPFKQSAGVDVIDVAKRLIDYGFHAPTVSFPVPGTMMIEPTESESKEELDRFCDALIQIRGEIQTIESGSMDRKDNPLMNAPHTQEMVTADNWNHPYTRQQAVFPTQWTRENKYWPPVGRVDNTHGDKNLICSCLPMESYEKVSSDSVSTG